MGLERNVLDVSSLYFGGAGAPRRFRCLEIESNRWGWGGVGVGCLFMSMFFQFDMIQGEKKKSI